MNGILCINKPPGYTSFDIVAKVRRIAQMKKVGHGGTLDPMATGVLPIFLGNATKVCDIMPDDGKEYIAAFQLGVTTDTQDCTGTVLTQIPSSVDKEQLAAALKCFEGEIRQVPPMYSALKVRGQKLYKLARQGIEVKREPRSIHIAELELLGFDKTLQQGKIRVLCSKGTYIRTLCHDIGQVLKTGAVLSELQRTKSGMFTLEDCVTLEEAEELAAEHQLESSLIPVEAVFEPLPGIHLNHVQSRMFLNGVRLDLTRLQLDDREDLHRVYDEKGTFLGLGFPNEDTMELMIYKMFYSRG